MIHILVKSPDGTTHHTTANNNVDAGNIIYAYINLGFTILKTYEDKPALDTLFIVQTSEGNSYAITPNEHAGIDHWFIRLAKTICFDDCSDERVIYIMYQGKEITYAGWQPNMLMEFIDSEGSIIWSNSFPEWDH